MKKNGRFCDQLLQKPKVGADLKAALKASVIIDATNISTYYYTDPQEHWFFKDFPCPVPPFEQCWLDFEAPKEVISEERGVIPWSKLNLGNGAPAYWGFLCNSYKLEAEEKITFIQTAPIWKDYQHRYLPYLEQIGWMIELVLYLPSGPNQPEYPYWFWSFFLDQNGEMIMQNEVDALSLSRTMDPILLAYIESIDSTKEREDLKRNLYNGVAPFWHTALLSFSFMNCKNIQFTDVKPEKIIPHTKAQKKRGEKAFQPVSYKVLNISPIQKVLADEGQEQIGTKEALARAKMRGHFVRGHFVNYTEERKLFGKLTGRYYRPMHRRGNDAAGKTQADYKIESPIDRPGK